MPDRKTLTLSLLLVLSASAFTLKAQTPHVISVLPTPQTIAAAPDGDILLTFDTALDPLSVADTTVRVFGRWSGPAAGAITLENGNTQVRFNPADNFFYGEWITVSLSKSVKSAGGQSLATGFYCNFWIKTLKGTLDLIEIKRVTVRQTGEGRVQTYGAYAGDLNHDGWSDLATPNERSNDVRVFLNDGAGDYDSFTIVPMPGASSPSTNEGADFDGDGEIDLALGSGGNNQMTVMFGDGAGGFLAPTNYTAGSSVRGLAIIDLDADGRDDIITANRNSSNLTWFRNIGSRLFDTAISMDPGGIGETACAAADANNDGIADLFVAARNSANMFLLLGDANGGLTVSSSVPLGGNPWMIAVGDLNGDGFVDVVTANSTSNNASVVFGDGAGGMSAATTYPTGAFAIAIDLGDIDGDGDLDMVSSNFVGNNWNLYENDGSGVFVNRRDFPASRAGSCTILHDRDNDGDLDMIGIDELDDLLFIFDNEYQAILISADTLIGRPPFTVSFTAVTDQTALEWKWHFGDGDSADVQSPIHTYLSPGLFTVSASIVTAESQFTRVLTDFVGVESDSLIPASVSGASGSAVTLEIYARNFLPQTFISIPFSWSGPLDVSFTGANNAGLRSSNMNGAIVNVDPFNKQATFTLSAPSGTTLAPGSGPIASILLTLPASGTSDTTVFEIQPFGGNSPLFFSTFGVYTPTTLTSTITLVPCCESPGDANSDGKVNIADVTFLIARIFAGGAAPLCNDEADANGDNAVNISDVTFLIARIFAGGAPPVCGATGL